MRNLWLALFLLLGSAPAQAQGVDPTVNPPSVFPGSDGNSLFVRQEPTQVFWDDFGTGTLDTTNRWNSPTTSGGGTSATSNVGFSTLGSGTTASGWSKLTSVPTFPGRNPGYLTIQEQVNVEFPVLLNAYRFWGIGSIPGSPTTTSPMTNAVGWALGIDGKLRAQTWASGTINYNSDLSIVQPAYGLCNCVGQPQDSFVHKYQISFRGDNILWFIDGKLVARVLTGAGGPDVNTLGIAALAVAGGTPPTSSATITLNQVTIGDSSRSATSIRDGTLPWQLMKINSDGSITSGGPSVSNATSGVASTSTNSPTVAYNYGYNGATWDQLQVDGAKNLKAAITQGANAATVKSASTPAANTDTAFVVDIPPRSLLQPGTFGTPSTQVLSVQNNDPCSYALKSSAAISVTTGTTTSLVAVSGSTVVYVCGFAITIAPSAVTAATALFEYGTGAACTSPTLLTGTFGNGDLTSAAGVAPILYGNGSATIFKSAAAAGICILTAGNAVSVQGVITYVQQ